MGPVTNELGPQKRIPASTVKEKLSEMDCLSIPEQGVSIYVGVIRIQKEHLGIYIGTVNSFG